MSEPVGDRPDLPDAYRGAAPLPWAWAEQQLLDARTYWITTVAPDGRPRARPVWGVWLDDTVMFSTGALVGRDVRAEPRVTVHLESGDECVIVEGTVRVADDEASRLAFIAAYDPKYEWTSSLEYVDVVYVVHPRVAFGWLVGDLAPGATLFEATATRWRFPA
jgi:hypothetical protein